MIDKIGHFGEFFILGILVSYSVGKQTLSLSKIFWISALFSGFYGAFDEFHQLFVSGRQADVFDAMADIIGGVSACGIYILIKIKSGSRRDDQ